ncbi:MAG: hypothetical protein A2Z16_11210 [Chloroflexi bacterium RBG_16_54_18]|nr:MAG: hypothetical protein A2Z16_11210 [Chloroflexi bacterium RBG_16_54_18]
MNGTDLSIQFWESIIPLQKITSPPWDSPSYAPVRSPDAAEAKLKSRLVQQAQLPPTGTFLDLGCSTGTLTLMIQTARPEARVPYWTATRAS